MHGKWQAHERMQNPDPGPITQLLWGVVHGDCYFQHKSWLQQGYGEVFDVISTIKLAIMSITFKLSLNKELNGMMLNLDEFGALY